MREESTRPLKTWLELCAEALGDEPLRAFVLETLSAFRGPFPRSDQAAPRELLSSGSFELLIQEHSRGLDALHEERWRTQVNAAQAELFVRRISAVDELLDSLRDHHGTLVSETLRLGLRIRCADMVRLGVRPAIRLRALADFYYSRAVLLRHGLTSLNTDVLRTTAQQLRWTVVPGEKGLWHARYSGTLAWGPQHITALKLDPNRYRIEILELAPDASEDLLERLEHRNAVAGSSGGFFLYSEPDIEMPSARYEPVGMVLHAGTVERPPVFHRAAVLAGDGSIDIRRVGLADTELHVQGLPIPLDRAINRANTDTGPSLDSIAIVGNKICTTGRKLAVPLNGLVVPWPAQAGPLPSVGTEVVWSAPKLTDGNTAQEGISGGPLLLERGELCIDYQTEEFWGSAPPITFSQDETGDCNLLARLMVGLDQHGFLYLVAVDGRQADHALGLSLHGCAAWMQGLGCVTAANMDGGSSKRLVLQGQVLDRPTTEVSASQDQPGDEQRVRPVFSGIAVIRK